MRHVGSYIPEQGLDLNHLHWKVNSEPLNHRETPLIFILYWNIVDLLLMLCYSKVIQLYIYIYLFFFKFFPI